MTAHAGSVASSANPPIVAPPWVVGRAQQKRIPDVRAGEPRHRHRKAHVGKATPASHEDESGEGKREQRGPRGGDKSQCHSGSECTRSGYMALAKSSIWATVASSDPVTGAVMRTSAPSVRLLLTASANM